MMGKPYSQYGVEPLMAGGLEELRGSSGVGLYIKNNFAHFNILCTLEIKSGNFSSCLK